MKIEFNNQIGILEHRQQKVVKHNDLIQKSRFSLSKTELKTINFLISLIKPKECYGNQIQPLEYEFEIINYCKICGIDYEQGKNYKVVRETLKSLRDKSIIMMLENGTETSVSWIQKFWANKGSGKVKIRFDEDIAPYLFDISGSTTRFELLNILPMKSKYSIRMYEICRSWARLRHKIYTIEELRILLMVSENELVNFKDFRRRVLETAQKEIVKNTDLYIYYEYITKGRKVIKVHIFMKEKSKEMKEVIEDKTNAILDKEE